MNVLVILITLFACVWLQGAIYERRWNKNIALSISFSETRATEGEGLYLIEIITNRKFLPLPWIAVKFQVSRHLLFDDHSNAQISDDFYRNDLFRLFMYQRITRKLRFTCGKRGIYTIKSADIVSSDILALHKLTDTRMTKSAVSTLTVYPRMINIDTYMNTHKQFLGDIRSRRYIQPDPFTFRGIREYQPTDTLRSVNFKATAKTGDLMVNIRDFTVTCEIIVLLNVDPYHAYPREDLFEQTLRLAASLAAYYIDNGIPLGLVTNACGIDPTYSGASRDHLTHLNEALARFDFLKPPVIKGKQMLSETHRDQESKRRAGREPAYILISTYHGKDLAESFYALKESGADALWIIPTYKDLEISVPLTERIVAADLLNQ